MNFLSVASLVLKNWLLPVSYTHLDVYKRQEYGWYLYLNGDEIIAMMDVIDNDFLNRKDLFSNVCGI